MHIPNSMLNGSVCPVTALLSALGTIGAAIWASMSGNKPSASRFGAVTALIFAAQMMNFPVQSGTSGHLLGGVLAVALLGLPFGVLAMAVVLLVQCFMFADGGFFVLGANVFNMAVIGAGLGGIILRIISERTGKASGAYYAGLGFAAWFSVICAAFACSVELSLSGTVPFARVAPAMLGTHALIGLGEALITVAVCYALSSVPVSATEGRSVYVPFAASVVIAGLLSPFASSFPDGLEWVADKYSFLRESAPLFVRPLPDYAVPSINNEMISTSFAGLAGVLVTFLAAWVIARAVSSGKRPIAPVK